MQSTPQSRTKPVVGSVASGAAALVDGALEVSVVGGFGSPGIRVRRRLFRWSALPRMDGRRVVITGATSGIGRSAAVEMARLGARLLIVGRDRARTQDAATAIEAESGIGAGAVSVVVADMADLDQVRRAADDIAAMFEGLDVLIHNAGAMTAQYRPTQQGFETTYAAQVLGPHVLTTRLLPVLARGSSPRVIVVSSGGMYAERLDATTVQMGAEEYDGVRAYARAKRAQVTLVEQWAARSRSQHVQFHSMHPGWVDTPGVQESLPTFRRLTRPILRTPAEGSDTIVWLASVDPIPAPSGTFWLDRRPRGTVRIPGTRGEPGAGRELWDRVVAETEESPAI